MCRSDIVRRERERKRMDARGLRTGLRRGPACLLFQRGVRGKCFTSPVEVKNEWRMRDRDGGASDGCPRHAGSS